MIRNGRKYYERETIQAIVYFGINNEMKSPEPAIHVHISIFKVTYYSERFGISNHEISQIMNALK